MRARLHRTLTLGLQALIVVTFAWACEVAPPPASADPPRATAETPTSIQAELHNRETLATELFVQLPPADDVPVGDVSADPGTWRGLVVVPEYRCAPYDADDYPYPQSVEQRIVAGMGGIIYDPYTGRWFATTRETDIEHIVARSEAHDSGLSAADAATKRLFSSDVQNLTLASPAVNRTQKSGNDATEWLPALNQCWFVDRVVQVRQTYGLTVDSRERDVLDAILQGCATTSMVVLDAQPVELVATAPAFTTGAGTGALHLYDDNGNGRITCADARLHGIAPCPPITPRTRTWTTGTGTAWCASSWRHSAKGRDTSDGVKGISRRGIAPRFAWPNLTSFIGVPVGDHGVDGKSMEVVQALKRSAPGVRLLFISRYP